MYTYNMYICTCIFELMQEKCESFTSACTCTCTVHVHAQYMYMYSTCTCTVHVHLSKGLYILSSINAC